jgi:mRNA-degrading endonuclease RelE of RelBE toxin-antitoxin system
MPDSIPLIRLYTTIQYEKEIKKLRKKYRSIENDLISLIDKLQTGETPGDKIAGNKYPVYKVRVKNSNNNKGQSGGYRIIYYTITPEAVLLTAIYSKSERANISNSEIEDRIDEFDRAISPQPETTPLDDEGSSGS